MVRIKGGTFTMGNPENESESDEEETQHQVTVSSFYMGKYPVTQKEYEAIMGINRSYFKGENNPVENVTWHCAIEYCNERSIKEGLTPVYIIENKILPSYENHPRWRVTWERSANGYRLPTEAEWEYACRAGTATAYNTGSSIDTSQANFNDNIKSTTEVGSYAPNAWGLYDMHGNVCEWCWDSFDAYSNEEQVNPTGPSSGYSRVGRGGGWSSSIEDLRSAARYRFSPSGRGRSLGSRLTMGEKINKYFRFNQDSVKIYQGELLGFRGMPKMRACSIILKYGIGTK
jgi:formylglycine-generating enzyme required for sulfatase activity